MWMGGGGLEDFRQEEKVAVKILTHCSVTVRNPLKKSTTTTNPKMHRYLLLPVRKLSKKFALKCLYENFLCGPS